MNIKKLLVGKKLKVTLIRGAALGLLVWALCTWVYLPYRAAGKSMEPTCMDGKFIFISALAYKSKKPQRGDIVAIRMAGQKVSLLKRIIALPGEVLAIKDGEVFVNDKPLEEAYLVNKGNWNLNQQTLASDEYFVIGDNRSMPQKAHIFGKAKAHKIIGKWK